MRKDKVLKLLRGSIGLAFCLTSLYLIGLVFSITGVTNEYVLPPLFFLTGLIALLIMGIEKKDLLPSLLYLAILALSLLASISSGVRGIGQSLLFIGAFLLYGIIANRLGW